jgi:DNA-binding PadR family transcriptional regulator
VARSVPQLTDDEGTFLALLVRVQPATAYQLSKIYAESPVSNFGTSKGKIYPLIRRLKERGMLASRAVAGDARKSEVLRATARGREAVRKWVRHIKPNHLLLEDPLRTMVQSFELLSKDEQIEWISNVQAGLEAKLGELEDYGASVHVPFKDQVHDNAVTAVESRLEWLERLRTSIIGRGTERRKVASIGSAKPRRGDRNSN